MLVLSLASPSNTLLTTSKPISANPKSSSSSSSIHGIPIKNVSFLRMSSSPSSPLSSSTSSSSSSVVMMAKRQEELDEIRSKTTEELNQEVMDLKGDLFVLRLKRSAKKDFKSSEFRRMRKKMMIEGYRIKRDPIVWQMLDPRVPTFGYKISWDWLLKENDFELPLDPQFEVARMLTIRRERELAEGIKKRQSRKLDRQWKKNIVVRPSPSMKELIALDAAERAKKSST